MSNALELKLQELREELLGYYPMVAKASKKSVTTVSRVLNGEQENDFVIQKAIEVRDRLRNKKEKLAAKI